jgi:hypothetical protein
VAHGDGGGRQKLRVKTLSTHRRRNSKVGITMVRRGEGEGGAS